MGVEFTIELMDKIDAAVRASKELENVSKAAKHADTATRTYERSTGLLGKTLSSAGGMLQQFGAHLAALEVRDWLRNRIDSVKEMGKAAFEAAAGAQRLEKSFGFMFGKEKGERLLDQADKTAKISQFSDDIHKQATQQLLAAGIQGERRLQILRSAAGDIAGKTGTGLGGFQGAISMFQMMQTTKAAPMGRALKEMGLGEGAGKAIEKEMATGTSAVDAFLTVLQKSNHGKAFGAIDEEMAKQAGVRAEKLADLPGQYFQQLSKTPAFEKLTDQLGKLLEAFDPDGPRGKRIFAGIETMVTKLVDMLAKIDVDKWTTTLLSAFEKLPRLIEASTKALESFARILGVIPDTKQLGGMPSAGKASAEATVSKPEGSAARPFIGYSKVADDPAMLEFVRRRNAAHGFWETTKAYLGIGSAAADGMAKGMEAGTPKVAAKAAEMGGAGQQATEKKLGIQSPSRVFAELGKYTSQGFALGIDEGMPDVAKSMARFSPEVLTPDLMAPARSAPIATTVTGGAGGTNVEAHIVVNVTAGGTGGEAHAHEVGQAAAEGARQAVQSLFEQMAAEGG